MKCLLLSLSIILFSVFAFANPGDPAPPIKGKVLTADGQPAASVTIRVKSNGRTTLTDDDGVFTLSNLPAGEYDLEVSLTGFATTTQHVIVEPRRTTNLSIRLQVSEQQLQEVVVTGGVNRLARRSSDDLARMPLKNTENPQVYTTITKDLLVDQLVQSVDDGLRNATGLQKMWDATGRSGDGGGYYNARGFILQSQLRNGVAGNVTSKIDAANLEKIEVLKGPSATLFGSTLGSYGGLINRVTKKPYDRLGGELNFTGGNCGYNRIGADINTPLSSDHKVLLRVNTAYTNEGSWQDNGFNKSFVFAPSLSYKAGDRLSFLFDAEIYRGRNITPPIFFFPYGLTIAQLGVNRADKLPLDYRRSYYSDDLSQQSASTNFFAQMHYRFNDSWTTQTNVTITNSYSDGPGPYFYLLPNGFISRNDQFTANSRDRMVEIQQNLNGDFNIGTLRNRFVAGLDYFNHTPNQLFSGGTYDTIASQGNIPAYRDFNRTNLQKLYATKGVDFYYPVTNITNTYSAYASDVLNLTDNLMVLAALRLDHFVNNGSYDVTGGTTTGGYNQTALSPKFGIVFQPVHDQVSLFANYQNGFTNETGADYKGRAFRPEQAWQTEAGVKVDLFDRCLTGTVSVYDIRVSNIVRAYIPSAPDSGLPAFPQIQDGAQRSTGVEAEVIANPFTGLNIVAGFSYNDSKYQRTDKDVEGRRPSTAASPYTANWWLSYKIPAGSLKGLGIGFGGNYASDNKIVNSVSQGAFILPAYTILSASLFYDYAKFRFTVKADNLTDQHSWVGYTTVNPQPLRSVKAGIAFKF
ncbi:MAG TPA: TonB-dependent receptor [Puia sp.]|uniref:TonB-dependent receptor n=1 Tax=Puia sp. TaxID=2045100 RepID=UPI002C2D6772|nr:TonB-dependent receptor [Puia sp.]HVU99139.1 TonB-dependent receptor [Puia sp.]